MNEYPAVVAHIKDELALADSDLRIKRIESLRFFDMMANCGGERLYAIAYTDFKVRDEDGKAHDLSGLHTGSGGTEVTLFTLESSLKGKPRPLFSEVLLDFWVHRGQESECPTYEVLMRGLDEGESMRTTRGVLEFDGKGYVARPRTHAFEAGMAEARSIMWGTEAKD